MSKKASQTKDSSAPKKGGDNPKKGKRKSASTPTQTKEKKRCKKPKKPLPLKKRNICDYLQSLKTLKNGHQRSV